MALNHEVFEPTAKDCHAVSNALAVAFEEDPVMSFIFPDPADRRKRLPRLFAILFEGDGAHGARFATHNCEAATLWRAPGMGHLSWFEKLQHGLPWLHAAGFSLARALSVSAASDAAHPLDPHWYLHIAGCRPESRGHGLASATIRTGLARADKERISTYLETANEENIGFYARFGFVVTHEWRVPNGPKHWSMRRWPAGDG